MLENLLIELCKFHSTSGRETELLGWLKKKLDLLNFKTKTQKVFGSSYNLIASRGKGGVWFVAHLDVYPNYDGTSIVSRHGNWFYGRGTVDVKGQIASLLCALMETSEAVQISMVVDEELCGRGSETLEVPDGIIGAVVLEPTNLKLGISEAGSLTVEAGFKGSPAHGSTPFKGESAIDMAIDSYLNLKNQPFLNHKHPLYEKGAWINLGKIFGGYDTMIVAPYCIMNLEIGFAPGLSSNQIISQMNLSFKSADYVHILDASEPWETSLNEPIVDLFKRAYKKSVGENIEFCGMYAWTDASNIIQKNIPAVIFGAGDLSLAHTFKERIDMGSLKTLTKTLTNLIKFSSQI